MHQSIVHNIVQNMYYCIQRVAKILQQMGKMFMEFTRNFSFEVSNCIKDDLNMSFT